MPWNNRVTLATWWVAEEPLLFASELERPKVVPQERFKPLILHLPSYDTIMAGATPEKNLLRFHSLLFSHCVAFSARRFLPSNRRPSPPSARALSTLLMVFSLRVPSNFSFWFLLTLILNATGCDLLVLGYCFILLITSLPQFSFLGSGCWIRTAGPNVLP